jgi:fumarate hydratase class II
MIAVISDFAGFQVESSDDLFESMQSMADMASFSGEMRTIALTLTRIANDFRLLSSGPSTGLDEIRLPVVQPGSSIMPGKVNPVMAEMLNMAMYHVIGADASVALASQAGQLELNVMMPVIAHNLFEMMQITIGSMRAFTEKCVLGVSANREKAEAWLEKNAIVVTALNPLIGYEAGAEIVKAAMEEGRSVKDVAVEMASRGELRARSEDRLVDPDEIEAALHDVGRLTLGGLIEN